MEANMIYKTYTNEDARSWYIMTIISNWEHEHKRNTS